SRLTFALPPPSTPFMPSNAASIPLRDIAHHIDLATQFAAGFDADTFRADLRTVHAVTRCLEIISEASRRLPVEMKARHPSIAWKEMAGAGNIYRHDYEDAAASYVW
ncbi:MAG: HepT-like ribonuclease domain-containing protein, partial [Acetobacteraceae bacterium]